MNRRLCDVFGLPVVVFEHGSLLGGAIAGNTNEHAHLHLVPCGVDLAASLEADGWATRAISGPDEVRMVNRPYLFVSVDGASYVADVSREIPGQYLRRLLYQSLYDRSDDGWNWRRQTHDRLLQITLEKLTHGNN